ncbi:MAG: hypothetical protein EHM20_03880 [Alphaproteobacteria bacterium]|nr:MAG: hypothetical protein EHM20_03880 [Alphaproteobacteria bacterium]
MVAIVCVCHKGEIELKTAFLLHTLKKYLTVPHKIYVAIPENTKHFMPPSALLFQLFEKYNAQPVFFNNSLLGLRNTIIAGDYTSNKIYALEHPFQENDIVFLDSDIAMLRTSAFKDFFQSATKISVKPANRANVISWGKIYAAARQQLPKTQILTSLDKVLLPPYFNSGVIRISSSIRHPFQKAWHEYMAWLWDTKVQQQLRVPPFHRDQVALSLTINKLKLEVTSLAEEYNFPLRGRKINPMQLPILVHYHHPFSICSNKELKNEFIQFLQQTPEIGSLIVQHKHWRNLFASGKLKRLYSIRLEKFNYHKSLLGRRFLAFFHRITFRIL